MGKYGRGNVMFQHYVYMKIKLWFPATRRSYDLFSFSKTLHTLLPCIFPWIIILIFVSYLLRSLRWLLIAYMLKLRYFSLLLGLYFFHFPSHYSVTHWSMPWLGLLNCLAPSTTWNNFFPFLNVQMLPILPGPGQMPSLPSGKFLGHSI